MEAKDTRKHPRYGISTEVEIHYGNRSITATAIDIGIGGVGVLSSSYIQPDTVATIGINIPEEVSFYCMAVWSLRALTKNRDGYRIGFVINGMLYEGTIHEDPSAIDKVIQKIISKYG